MAHRAATRELIGSTREPFATSAVQPTVSVERLAMTERSTGCQLAEIPAVCSQRSAVGRERAVIRQANGRPDGPAGSKGETGALGI